MAVGYEYSVAYRDKFESAAAAHRAKPLSIGLEYSGFHRREAMGFVIAIIIILILYILYMMFVHGADDPLKGIEQKDEEQLQALGIDCKTDESASVVNSKG